MAELLQQHTDATGQTFEAGVLDEIWADTQGQPWLVNALAYEACFRNTGWAGAAPICFCSGR